MNKFEMMKEYLVVRQRTYELHHKLFPKRKPKKVIQRKPKKVIRMNKHNLHQFANDWAMCHCGKLFADDIPNDKTAIELCREHIKQFSKEESK